MENKGHQKGTEAKSKTTELLLAGNSALRQYLGQLPLSRVTEEGRT